MFLYTNNCLTIWRCFYINNYHLFDVFLHYIPTKRVTSSDSNVSTSIHCSLSLIFSKFVSTLQYISSSMKSFLSYNVKVSESRFASNLFPLGTTPFNDCVITIPWCVAIATLMVNSVTVFLHSWNTLSLTLFTKENVF